MGLYDVNWRSSMQQTFSFYKVDSTTWKDTSPIDSVINCTITKDKNDETLGYCTMTADNIFGEQYIRIYLDVTQDNIFHHIPIGTYLTQTNFSSFNGKKTDLQIDAFSPLIELKEKKVPIGYFIPAGVVVLKEVQKIIDENCRAPISENTKVFIESNTYKMENAFVANVDENWFTYLNSLLNNLNFEFGLNDLGEIEIQEQQTVESKTKIWTYSDDEESILYPEISLNQDLYGIPNVIEILTSSPVSEKSKLYRAENKNPSSPISIQNRGREVIERTVITDLISSDNTDKYYSEMANSILHQKSTIEYTVSYKHGFCPVHIGDCVEIDYARSKLGSIKAKVMSQSIECVLGCPVSETASYTVNMWR